MHKGKDSRIEPPSRVSNKQWLESEVKEIRGLPLSDDEDTGRDRAGLLPLHDNCGTVAEVRNRKPRYYSRPRNVELWKSDVADNFESGTYETLSDEETVNESRRRGHKRDRALARVSVNKVIAPEDYHPFPRSYLSSISDERNRIQKPLRVFNEKRNVSRHKRGSPIVQHPNGPQAGSLLPTLSSRSTGTLKLFPSGSHSGTEEQRVLVHPTLHGITRYSVDSSFGVRKRFGRRRKVMVELRRTQRKNSGVSERSIHRCG